MTMGQQFDSPYTVLEVQCESTDSAQFIDILFPLVISTVQGTHAVVAAFLHTFKT